MSVRARFRVDSVKYTGPGQGEVELSACTSGSDEESAEFFKWTPWGTLKMGILNESALEQLKPGQDYYLDLTPVE